MAIAEEVLADYTGNPRVAAFWAPRLARFATWFAETEPARRTGIARILSEVDGKLVLAGPAGPFTLTARADRIDVGRGGLVITDYKTEQNLQHAGVPRRRRRSAAAAAGSRHRGRQRLRRRARRAGGGCCATSRPRAASRRARRSPSRSTMSLPWRAPPTTASLVSSPQFDQPGTPYRAVRRARFNYDYDDYAHLARVAEWPVDSGEEDAP